MPDSTPSASPISAFLKLCEHKTKFRKHLKTVMVREGICRQSAHGLKNSCSCNCSRFNSFFIVFCPISAPVPSFLQIGSKIQKLKIVNKWSLCLVGLVGKKNGRRHFKLILCCFWSIICPHTKFHSNRTKNTAGNGGKTKKDTTF